jgi:parallel beta-helix repeat protein
MLENDSCNLVLLDEDISTTSSCIYNPIGINGKTFDCQGHSITGDRSGNDYGIYLTWAYNFTIKNCQISNFHDGIYLYDHCDHNTLVNITSNNNYYSGVLLNSYSSYNTLINITTEDNSYEGGVYLTGSSNYNTLTNITSNNNQYGVRLYSSSYNILTNITANNNRKYGIRFRYNANYNTVTNAISDNNHEQGISLDSSSYNTLANITSNNNNYGFVFYYSDNNNISNSDACFNNQFGFYFNSGADNNYGDGNAGTVGGPNLANNPDFHADETLCKKLVWGYIDDQSVEVGSSLLIETNITNKGDENATNVVFSSNAPNEWNAKFTPQSYSLLEIDETKPVNYSITIPYSDHRTSFQVALEASSNEYAPAHRYFTINILQPQPSIANINDRKAGLCEIFNITVNVTNTGAATYRNASLSADCNSLICSWNETSLFNLSPSQTKTRTLTIEVPCNESDEQEQITITVSDPANRMDSEVFFINISVPHLIWNFSSSSCACEQQCENEGNITNDGSTAFNVSLSVSCKDGWICSINNTFIQEIKNNETIPLKVTYHVPKCENSNDVINLHAEDKDGREWNSSFDVHVIYPHLSLTPQRNLNITRNTTYNSSILTSSSPQTSNATLSIDCPQNWICTLNKSFFQILTEENVSVSISVPFNETKDRNITFFLVDECNRNTTQTWNIHIPKPHSIIEQKEFSIKVGKNKTISTLINNTGDEDDKEITITEYCPQSWTCSFNPTFLSSLSISQTHPLNFYYEVPLNETNETKHITINATDYLT